MIVAMLGCALNTGGPEREEVDGRVTAGDTLYAARARFPANLDLAMEAWRAVLADDPGDTAVLARLARGEWVKHLVDPGLARMHLETGQEYGWRCLLAYPGFGAAAHAGGYRFGADAVATLPKEAAACLTWTLANGVRLVDLRGPGASLELEPLALLSRRLESVAPGGQQAMGWWALGRLRLSAEDPVGAREAFDRAVSAEPAFLYFQVERAAAFPDAGGTFAEEDGDYALENAAVRSARRPSPP